MLSSRVGEVTKHFPDIPRMFNFGLSTVQFGAVGVFCNRVLQKGKFIFVHHVHSKMPIMFGTVPKIIML